MSTLLRALSLVVSCLFVLACSVEEEVRARTQLLLRIDTADDTIRRDIHSLSVRLFAEYDGQWNPGSRESYTRQELTWPVELPVLARDQSNIRRPFEIVVQASSKDGVLAESRAVVQFAAGRRVVLTLHLDKCSTPDDGSVCADSGCHGSRCETCRMGACTPAGEVDGNDLPEWSEVEGDGDIPSLSDAASPVTEAERDGGKPGGEPERGARDAAAGDADVVPGDADDAREDGGDTKSDAEQGDAEDAGSTEGPTSPAADAATKDPVDGSRPDAAGPNPPVDSGAEPKPDSGNPDMGRPDAGTPSTPTPTGVEPRIPAIVGTCPELRNGTVMVAGRGAITIVAGEPNKKGPLVFYWHGTGSTAGEYRLMMGAVADQIVAAGGVLASFSGQQKLSGGTDCSGTGTHNSNDFNAADAIVACAVKNHGIDPKRIYTTGCSSGGLQAGCMGMMRSSYIAAVATNSGGITMAQPWESAASPAVFTMHGSAADMVIVSFSETSAQYDKAAKSHGSFVVNCDHGGSHCGAPGSLYAAAWRFLQDHPFGTPAANSPWRSSFPAGVPSYCKVFE